MNVLLSFGLLAPLTSGAALSADLNADLAELVALQSSEARRERAAELANKPVPLDAWLEAMRAFGNFDDPTSGARQEQLELFVTDQVETLELIRAERLGSDGLVVGDEQDALS